MRTVLYLYSLVDIWFYIVQPFCIFQLEPDNEMDKIIKYILDRDIQIRALDAKYNTVSLDRSKLKLQGTGATTFAWMPE